MQQLWPTLLSASLVVSSGSAILGGAAAQPDAAAAAAPFPLFDSCCQREQHGAVCELNVPLPQRLGMPTGSCRFTFAQPAAEPRLQAEARHFAEALQTSIHHQTKNIIEVRALRAGAEHSANGGAGLGVCEALSGRRFTCQA